MTEFSWDLKDEELIWGMFSTKMKKYVQRACDKKEYYLLKDLKAGQHDWSKEMEGEGWASCAGNWVPWDNGQDLGYYHQSKAKPLNYR